MNDLGEGELIRQVYINFDPEVRVRIKGNRGYLTIKSRGGLTRQEFEYSILLADAEELLKLSRARTIEKRRYQRESWEIDVYEGHLRGLIIAEIELNSPQEVIQRPDWFDGYDVTDDPRYKNQQLAMVNAIPPLES